MASCCPDALSDLRWVHRQQGMWQASLVPLTMGKWMSGEVHKCLSHVTVHVATRYLLHHICSISAYDLAGRLRDFWSTRNTTWRLQCSTSGVSSQKCDVISVALITSQRSRFCFSEWGLLQKDKFFKVTTYHRLLYAIVFHNIIHFPHFFLSYYTYVCTYT